MKHNCAVFLSALLAISAACGCGGVKSPNIKSSGTGTTGAVDTSGTSVASSTSGSSSSGTSDSGNPSTGSTSASSSPVPHSNHVFLLIDENQSFNTVYNNQMPFLSSLAQTYAYAANYTSTDGGSMLDYLVLSSGNDETANYGCQGWGCPNQLTNPINDDNIFRELTKAGKTWKVYAESLPQVGYLGDGPYPYVSRHNPAVWYSDVVNSQAMQQNVVPFTQFATDLKNGTLPDYAVIIPNLLDDAHDGTPAAADKWLSTNLGALLNSSVFSSGGDGLMFITFDECASGTNAGCGSHVLTTVIGPKVHKGFVSNQPYNHLSTLRTIMDALGIKVYPGGSATAQDMTDFFN